MTQNSLTGECWVGALEWGGGGRRSGEGGGNYSGKGEVSRKLCTVIKLNLI